jgi:hypothetical protein
MGNSNWNSNAYSNYSRTVSSKPREEIFTNTRLVADLDPSKFVMRESCDSPANPNSTPIILAVDHTGSMGELAELIIKKGLGTIMENIISKKPVPDPHILMAIFGDATCDSAPIQATQFEADIVLVKQIEKFYIEGNGGGNGGESYMLPWFLAVNKCKCDAHTKHGRKGYLFTAGDESCLDYITKEQAERYFGIKVQFSQLPTAELLSICQMSWNVFHLITPTHATDHQGAIKKWRDLMGERAIVVEDWKRMPEIIVSLMQINEGQNKEDVISAWDGSTQDIVRNAVRELPQSSSRQNALSTVEEI